MKLSEQVYCLLIVPLLVPSFVDHQNRLASLRRTGDYLKKLLWTISREHYCQNLPKNLSITVPDAHLQTLNVYLRKME